MAEFRPDPIRPTKGGTRLAVRAALLLVVAAAGCGESGLEDRRVRVETMNASERETLRLKKRRFDELTIEDQQRMRALHEQITGDPRHDELQQMLERYSQWLRALAPSEQAELRSLPPDERVARIRQLLKEQEDARFRRLVDARNLQQRDLQVLYEWVDDYLERHQDEFMERVDDGRRDWLQRIEDQQLRRRMLFFQFTRRGWPDELRPGPEEMERLFEQLSPEARHFVLDLPDEDRESVVGRWVAAAVASRMQPPLSAERLQSFISELPAAQRDYLENLPRDTMLREAHRLYYEALRDESSRSLRFRPGFSPGDGPFRGSEGRRHGPPGGRHGRPGSGEARPDEGDGRPGDGQR